jgi:DNA-binding winged helix-turn-helix (wHTH) protein
LTLQRTRLLARLFASEPRLLRLWAPAGYGKTALVRLFARRFDRHGTCDCTGVSGAVDFADRAMAALAAEAPEGGDAIAATRLRLHANEADTPAWCRALLDSWKGRGEHALFILEHAEAVAENGGVLALLGDLLAARPPERVVVISSRVALPLRFAHYLAPHHTLTLSQHELRYEADEATAIFEGSELAPRIVSRIVQLADGWPIVLLLLALFAQYEANIEPLLDRLSGIAAGDLYQYLANELLTAFTPDMMATMLTTASIPNASLEDISAATGIRHATPIVDRLLGLPGFISAETGVYQTHPLLLTTLRARHGADLANYLVRAAHEYERCGDALRAAELYNACGDEKSAAAALDGLPITELAQPAPRVIDALAKIRMSTQCAHPNLWIATLPYRRQHVDPALLYDEGRRLLQSLLPAAPALLQRRLRFRLAMLAQELEKLSEANALVETGDPPNPLDDAPEERRLVLMTSALVAAKQGRFSAADRLADESDAVHGARHARFDAERAQIAVEKARFLGDWHGVLKMSEEALHAAQRSGATPRIVEAARSVARAAWYCNDDARETAANQLLEDCGDSEVRLLARRVEAVLGNDVVEAPARDLQIARWHAALSATSIEQARTLFDDAIAGIDTVENDFLRVAIRVCAALLLPTERRRLLEARVIAQKVESPPLQASLELLIDSPEPSDLGIFRYLAARVARSPLKAREDVLCVDVARGEIRRGTEVLHVSDRGLELLTALALLPAGRSREELAGTIWPSLDADDALNTLKMCVSRTRAQVAEKDAIASTKRGYSLNERVTVDVRGYERLLRSVTGSAGLGDSVRRQVEQAIEALEPRARAHVSDWVWFAPHAAHLEDLRHGLSLVLAKSAWHGDDVPAMKRASASASN